MQDVGRLRNVRDVGGLPFTAGGTTRRGVLLRADAPRPDDAAPDDLPWPPRTVIDLRSGAETHGEHPLAADAVVHGIPLSADAAVDGLARTAAGGLDALYSSIVDVAGPLFVRTIELLADAPAPALVHCTAGKDRTGLVVALLLTAIGVDRDAVVEDYAATQANMDGVIARIGSGTRVPGATDWRALVAAADPEILTAPAPAMARVLRELDERGGAAAWLTGHGLHPAVLHRLGDRLREPPGAAPPG
jgi:hypothetical protein